jgi:hypothetical protein
MAKLGIKKVQLCGYHLILKINKTIQIKSWN